jgi:two-component system phosphate regulon response regulator OmpR
MAEGGPNDVDAGEHIVVVDDDARLRNRLSAYLEGEGYRVTAADGGAALRRVMADDAADLVILDLVMPGEDGLSLTRYLRADTDVPILILTGKGDPVDRIVGLEMGADDYLAKPFVLRELLARVRSILRRAKATARAADVGPAAEIVFDDWRLDLARRQLFAPDGAEMHLTSAEYKLLAALVDNANRVLNRDQLLDAAGDRDWQPFDRSIDLHISHLRRKIEDDPKKPRRIKTVRGEGYMFSANAIRRT